MQRACSGVEVGRFGVGLETPIAGHGFVEGCVRGVGSRWCWRCLPSRRGAVSFKTRGGASGVWRRASLGLRPSVCVPQLLCWMLLRSCVVRMLQTFNTRLRCFAPSKLPTCVPDGHLCVRRGTYSACGPPATALGLAPFLSKRRPSSCGQAQEFATHTRTDHPQAAPHLGQPAL